MKLVQLYTGTKIWALQDADIASPSVAAAIEAARSAWAEDLSKSGGDRGTCVIGAGLAVPYVGPRKRKIQHLILVEPPGLSDCKWCVHRAREILDKALPGVEVSFAWGRMD